MPGQKMLCLDLSYVSRLSWTINNLGRKFVLLMAKKTSFGKRFVPEAWEDY